MVAMQIFSQILPRIPILLIFITGIVLSFINLNKLKKAAIFSLIAFLILMVLEIISLILNGWLMGTLYEAFGVSQMAVIFSIINIVQALVAAVAWVLLLLALFAKRETPSAA